MQSHEADQKVKAQGLDGRKGALTRCRPHSGIGTKVVRRKSNSSVQGHQAEAKGSWPKSEGESHSTADDSRREPKSPKPDVDSQDTRDVSGSVVA